jgi:plastocyanin
VVPRRAALAVLLLPPLAACGTPSRLTANAEHATRRPHESVHPTVFPSRTPSPPPAATGGTAAPTQAPTSAPPADPNAVAATVANRFEPNTTTVKVGTTVTWSNHPGGYHTVTGGEPAKPDMSLMNGTLSDASPTYAVTFTKAGTYTYFCQPHASVGMTGEIVVR